MTVAAERECHFRTAANVPPTAALPLPFTMIALIKTVTLVLPEVGPFVDVVLLGRNKSESKLSPCCSRAGREAVDKATEGLGVVSVQGETRMKIVLAETHLFGEVGVRRLLHYNQASQQRIYLGTQTHTKKRARKSGTS